MRHDVWKHGSGGERHRDDIRHRQCVRRLGYPDAEGRQTKSRLVYAINGVISRRQLTQVRAAKRLGVSQPKISALANYKLDGFSVERLMLFLSALGQDVEIVIHRKPRSRRAGRISVVAMLVLMAQSLMQ